MEAAAVEEVGVVEEVAVEAVGAAVEAEVILKNPNPIFKTRISTSLTHQSPISRRLLWRRRWRWRRVRWRLWDSLRLATSRTVRWRLRWWVWWRRWWRRWLCPAGRRRLRTARRWRRVPAEVHHCPTRGRVQWWGLRCSFLIQWGSTGASVIPVSTTAPAPAFLPGLAGTQLPGSACSCA